MLPSNTVLCEFQYVTHQGRIQPVSLGGAISVIYGSQVSFTSSLL